MADYGSDGFRALQYIGSLYATPDLDFSGGFKALQYIGSGSPPDIDSDFRMIDTDFDIPDMVRFLVSWSADTTVSNGFIIQRRKDPGDWVEVASVNNATLNYIDAVPDDDTYEYRVFSFNGDGLSQPSNVVARKLDEINFI